MLTTYRQLIAELSKLSEDQLDQLVPVYSPMGFFALRAIGEAKSNPSTGKVYLSVLETLPTEDKLITNFSK